MSIYRKISEFEIARLVAANCRAENWAQINVKNDFDAHSIRNCYFKGTVNIGNNVRIYNIGSHIANYTLSDGACIENVDVLETTSDSTFGNGVRAAVINEAGGREVTLFDGLTAQSAYIMALYRHRPDTIARIENMAAGYSDSIRSGIGTVGENAKVTNSGIIRNVNIGAAAEVDGAAMLFNGTINSSAGNVARIGVGAKLYDFIVLGNSRIDNDACLRKCFVGEGVTISGLTANDSVFFANSNCENGEVCSVFAGPYTVSHHKSTLLIAGMFSFFNAGSGANQSNHLFKTGAVHQGIHQRGCKFGSDAYVMLPAKDGAFTIVLGRHKNHPNTENFPYSYLTEEGGVSFLLPAINLTSYGTVRDIAKWPVRDSRGDNKRDLVNFEECNPFITERILRAIEKSEELLAKTGVDTYIYERTRIKASMLRRGLGIYKLARDKFIGVMLSGGIDAKAKRDTSITEHWIDAAGMFIPKSKMEAILDNIDKGTIKSLAELNDALSKEHSAYREYAYNWALIILESALGHEASKQDIDDAIQQGIDAGRKLEELTDADRRKDADATMSIGYGIDAETPEEITADFKTVRSL